MPNGRKKLSFLHFLNEQEAVSGPGLGTPLSEGRGGGERGLSLREGVQAEGRLGLTVEVLP